MARELRLGHYLAGAARLAGEVGQAAARAD
jgi:hypothetical protein